MKAVEYPREGEVGSNWVQGFAFPEGFKAKVLARFPDWPDMKIYLADNDQCAWELLREYRSRLGTIKAEEILEADEKGELKEIVARVREALNLATFIDDLEKEFFPEKIRAREECQRRALDSWQY